MPGLVALGRRWEAASDDLVFPTIIESCIRLIWFIGVIIIWSYHSPYLDCEGGHMIQIYLCGVSSILLISIAINIALIRQSMKGTIMDTMARKHVPKFIYFRILLGIPELIWTIVGSAWAFQNELKCSGPDMTLNVVRGLIICNWVLLFFIILGVVMVFDPLGHRHHVTAAVAVAEAMQEVQSLTDHGIHQRTRIWEWRCRLLCCSCFPGCCGNQNTGDGISMNDAFNDVAGVFTSLFHDFDLVPSDIAAGLLLLHLRHKLKREEHRQQGFAFQRPPVTGGLIFSENVLTSSPKLDSRGHPISRADFSPSALSVPASAACSPDVVMETPRQLEDILEEPSLVSHHAGIVYDWMNPLTAFVYMKYALGAYGWLWYLYGGFWNGLCKLKEEIVCCSCLRSRSQNIADDNCCDCNVAALKAITNLEDKDLIFVSFHNRVFEVPYYVAVDHQTSSVIVSIRGTLSLHDALTDLAAVTDSITCDGLPQEWTAHKGILQAANFVLRRIEMHQILQRAFQLYPSYNLVITGHSLGAGAAVILAMLLKPRFPKVRCFAFSPPGGLLNEAAARYTETFCMSIVVGDDLVPRLSLTTLELLKRQLLAELESCRHPKYRIFLRGCWEVIFGKPTLFHRHGMRHPLLNETPVNSYSYESLTDVARHLSPVTSRSAINASKQLYLPGRILQVEEKESLDSTSDTRTPFFEARWMQREDYNQILVTPRMLSDHVPDKVLRILRGLSLQYENAFGGISVNPHEA